MLPSQRFVVTVESYLLLIDMLNIDVIDLQKEVPDEEEETSAQNCNLNSLLNFRVAKINSKNVEHCFFL